MTVPRKRGARDAAARHGASRPSAPLAALEAHWLRLTRETLPGLATSRGWPVSADHCFQRILLDNGCGGRWYRHIAGRPAFVHATDDQLARAVALGEAAAAGEADMATLNRRSLGWRGKAIRAGLAGSEGPTILR